jgi:hypothetical protein
LWQDPLNSTRAVSKRQREAVDMIKRGKEREREKGKKSSRCTFFFFSLICPLLLSMCANNFFGNASKVDHYSPQTNIHPVFFSSFLF